MRKIFTLFFCAASLATGLAQQESYFTNPVIHGDVADPSIIRIDQTYYITGTSSEWAPYYPVFTSTDLVNWQQTGHVFDEKPEWTKSSFWLRNGISIKGRYMSIIRPGSNRITSRASVSPWRIHLRASSRITARW